MESSNAPHKTHLYLLLFSIMCTAAVLFVAYFATSSVHPQKAYAQFVESGPLAGGSISLKPAYPRPGDTVTATFKTSHIDLSQSVITWRLNGEVVQQGYSDKTYKFSVGDIGSVFILQVSAENQNGKRVAKSATIRVGKVSIAWEARTYTPPFYGGRALRSPGSAIALLALPSVMDENGTLIDPSTLTYMWSIDKGSSSVVAGRGKQSAILASEQPFDPFTISLKVKDMNGEIRAVAKITIPVVRSKVLFYEDNPLLGIRYETALQDTHTIPSEEVVVVAEPYYMSSDSRSSDMLTYEWHLNNETYDFPGSIILRPEGVGAGSARINTIVTNKKFRMQKTREELTILFGIQNGWENTDTNPKTIVP